MKKDTAQVALDALKRCAHEGGGHSNCEQSYLNPVTRDAVYGAMAALELDIARVVEPVYQYQLANGSWIDQTKESHKYNVAHGQATVRALYAAPQEAAAPAWMPIETAPEGQEVVVMYVDDEDGEARHSFDVKEDGSWVEHLNHFEWANSVAPPGSRMPKESAPYTHWMPLPAAPGSAT